MSKNLEKILIMKRTFRPVKFHIFFDFLSKFFFSWTSTLNTPLHQIKPIIFIEMKNLATHATSVKKKRRRVFKGFRGCLFFYLRVIFLNDGFLSQFSSLQWSRFNLMELLLCHINHTEQCSIWQCRCLQEFGFSYIYIYIYIYSILSSCSPNLRDLRCQQTLVRLIVIATCPHCLYINH